MDTVDTFESSIPFTWLEFLLDLGVTLGFDPTSSLEMEAWCNDLIDRCEPDGEEALKREVTRAFRCLAAPPEWLQGCDWPLEKSGPLIFVGQIDLPPVAGLFNNQTSFYTFYDLDTGALRSVMQIA